MIDHTGDRGRANLVTSSSSEPATTGAAAGSSSTALDGVAAAAAGAAAGGSGAAHTHSGRPHVHQSTTTRQAHTGEDARSHAPRRSVGSAEARRGLSSPARSHYSPGGALPSKRYDHSKISVPRTRRLAELGQQRRVSRGGVRTTCPHKLLSLPANLARPTRARLPRRKLDLHCQQLMQLAELWRQQATLPPTQHRPS